MILTQKGKAKTYFNVILAFKTKQKLLQQQEDWSQKQKTKAFDTHNYIRVFKGLVRSFIVIFMTLDSARNRMNETVKELV